MEKGVVAVNFPVAHNKNWKDKRTGDQRTKTTWVNCTIWKKDTGNLRVVDFLTKGTLVEVIGVPFAKGYLLEDDSVKAEIRLNVSKTNILKPSKVLSNEELDLFKKANLALRYLSLIKGKDDITQKSSHNLFKHAELGEFKI